MRLSVAKKQYKQVKKILNSDVDKYGSSTDAARSAARLWLRKFFRKQVK
jgi:hypothetical protein